MTERAIKHRDAYLSYAKNRKAEPSSYFLDAYVEAASLPPDLREAKALRALWSSCALHVMPEELVVGSLYVREPVGFHIGSATFVDRKAAAELADFRGWSEEEREALEEKLSLVDRKRYMPASDPAFIALHGAGTYSDEELAAIATGAATSTFFGGHMVLDYEGLLARGLDDYQREISARLAAASGEKADFYRAMEEILLAFQILILRHADRCAELGMAEKARELASIAHGRPESFSEALQLVWFAHLCSSADTFGRFDKYLYPYYERDLAQGRLTEESALGLLESLMIKIEEADSIQNMTVGGEGSVTGLTLLVLRALRETGYKGPNLCFRVWEGMPEYVWNEIAETLATGQGLPALYNERVMIAYLMKYGVPEEEAKDFCLAGCSQVMIPGKTQFYNDIGLMNAAKILELILHGGRDPLLGLDCGPVFGSFDSFDELLDAYLSSLSYFARLEAEVNDKDILLRAEREGYALRSLFTLDCLEKGRGCYRGGARYNGVQLEIIGLTNAADSLYAVKKAVFDDKIVDMNTLLDALRSDFEGYGELRAYLVNRCAKFGNGNAEVDGIRKTITERVYSALRACPGPFGGSYIPGEVIFIVHDWMGKQTGATPDGRLARAVLADSAGAAQGRDRSGPTALVNSMLSVPVDGIVTTVALNLKFSKAMWKTDRAKALSLFKTYFEKGGQQVQVNVCDRETLVRAMESPEEYKSLVVRVGGYSAYFHTLSKALMQDVIDRSEL